MVAQLQSVLTRAPRGARLAGALLAAACAGPAPAPRPPAPIAAPTAQRPVIVPPAPLPEVPGLGPEILLPDPNAVDAEVARVGDVSLRKSHVYTRLLRLDPKRAFDTVDQLVFDVLVARHAEQYGIRVPLERVEEIAAAEEKRTRQMVASEFGGQLDLRTWVWRVFSVSEADWQRLLRLDAARLLYQGYVIRYLALREDRVHVRFLVHKDEKLVAEIADKVRAGADFATLASRHSEDESRRDGGLLPPIGVGSEHAIAKTAFTLGKGEVSAPFQARWGDETRWFLVYCLDRMPGRDVPFADVAAEIDRDLAKSPLSRHEGIAYSLRWGGDRKSPPPATTAAPHDER